MSPAKGRRTFRQSFSQASWRAWLWSEGVSLGPVSGCTRCNHKRPFAPTSSVKTGRFSFLVTFGLYSSKTGRALDRLGSAKPGSDQANVRALLQNLSVPETQCRFKTRSTMESSSFMLIIIWSLPGQFIITDIFSQALSLRKYHNNIVCRIIDIGVTANCLY
jgi:hypothetical protein